jgi:hypothetical protein
MCTATDTTGPLQAGRTTQYVLGASCKAEQVHVTENVWHDPAADMCLVASPDEFLVIKSWDRNNRGVMLSPPTLGEQPERQVGRCSEAFTALNLTHKFADARLLTSTEEIVDAVLNDRPLVSQTEYSAGKWHARVSGVPCQGCQRE